MTESYETTGLDIGVGNGRHAELLAENGNEVTIWCYEEWLPEAIERQHENPEFLPGYELPASVGATNDLEEAISDRDMILSVPPSHVVRDVLSGVAERMPDGVPIVSATKGIENETTMLVSDILEEILPQRCHPYLAFLSGPSFAVEVADHQPTAVTVASYNHQLAKRVQEIYRYEKGKSIQNYVDKWGVDDDLREIAAAMSEATGDDTYRRPMVFMGEYGSGKNFLAKRVQEIYSNDYFRCYTSTDVRGVEVGGSVKNVIAIAAGAAMGLGLGQNSLAGMMTRGLHEITKLAVRLGADASTLRGLAGMGDLVLTCSSETSRNHTVGRKLGQGMSLDEVLEDMNMVAEGVKTSRSVRELAEDLDLEMPISREVYRVLHEDKAVETAVEDLMGRDLKPEFRGYF
ncbi:MAG: NAD(P)H-dependent glycerol-3-phosphate dehydrogenase [Bradymonadaceae bacterium]